MTTWLQRRRAAASARKRALRARSRLELLDQARVEIFDVIDASGVWLMFQPLDGLLGFYQRIDDVPGIVINAERPQALQRYTAAHEFGHHVLGHPLSLDGTKEITGELTSPEDPIHEIEAQAFAGGFLMPLHLVNSALAESNLSPPNLTPADVYGVSLTFGVSYEAALIQLRTYRAITAEQYSDLSISPLKIKQALGDGEPPTNHRADLWVVDASNPPPELPLNLEDELVVRLPERRSTGYRWRISQTPNDSLAVLEDTAIPNGRDDEVLGGTTGRRIRFRAERTGKGTLGLVLARAFGSRQPEQQLQVPMDIAPPATGAADHGLFVRQQGRLAARRQ
jgi:Zn-dependent peptidase ImmA (M78 family)/predicted secreted protein